MPLLVRCLAAGLALVAASAAGANVAASSSARLDGFVVTLVDLAPDDGLAPWVSFAGDGRSRAWAHSFSGIGYQGEVDSMTRDGDGPWSAALAEGATARSSVRSELANPGPLVSGMALTATAQAQGPGSAGQSDLRAGYGASVVAPSADVGQFTLSPHTRLEISAVASVAVTVGAGWDGDWQSSNSYAQAWMRLLVPDPPVPGIFSTDGCAIAAALTTGTDPGPGGGCGSFSGGSRSIENLTLFVALDNTAGTPMNGTFMALVSLSGGVHTNPAPIPEPATTLMLLSGLALLATRARRATTRAGRRR
ncbi:MAG: PEP-CTERM sorting domain-containing protein [Rubrivivax sp.]|nr:PEP-CTERM sorting domain-containing protein [Rubrivivax sp.]